MEIERGKSFLCVERNGKNPGLAAHGLNNPPENHTIKKRKNEPLNH